MNMKNFYRLPRRFTSRNDGVWGFTLLELLVVIGIIGILVALATVAYASTQKSGRNSRRKQDMVAVQNALEQYYGANTFVYPNNSCESDAMTYLKSAWPVDPSNNATYTYTISSCTTTSYCICAKMESDSLIGNSAADCDFSGAKTHYCVANLQ
jgi:general secretion pathway protein G